MMWLKRLITWLCPPKPSVQEQLRKWVEEHSNEWLRFIRRSAGGTECAMPPMLYRALLDELEQVHRVMFGSTEQDGLWFEAMWCYPDPTVKEFTAR